MDIAMANPENLKGHEFTSDQSREEAARNGRKGGKASGEARRRRKELRELVNIAFERVVSHDKDGRPITADERVSSPSSASRWTPSTRRHALRWTSC